MDKFNGNSYSDHRNVAYVYLIKLMMKKLPNILFFLIIIIGGVLIYLIFGGDPAITPKNLVIEDIEKIEITNYQEDKTITIDNNDTIDSLISLLYTSQPIKVDNPAISKGCFFIKVLKATGKTESIKVSESKKEGRYHTRGKFKYRNDSFFDMVSLQF